jgi:acetyl-CoA acyltransferase 1
MHRVEVFLSQATGKSVQSAEVVASVGTAAAAPVTKSSLGKPGVKSDDDIVIVSALRTAITKARRGAFKDTFAEDLLAAVFKGVVDESKVDPKLIGDIVVGSVLGANVQRANEARMAALISGIPDSVPIHTINRQCSSGLQAVAHVAASIKAGYYDMGLAAGVETMSLAKFGWDGAMNPKVFLNQQAKDCLLPMGITSENVATQWKITRKEQDELAALSHKRAVAAIKAGKFKAEIVPVKTTVVDPKTGAKKEVTVDTDEGARADTTFEGLSKLKPAFQPGGSTTAGNASQVSDGAAAVLLTTRKRAKELGLAVLGSFRGFTSVGVPPSVMGIGPAFAIPAVLEQTGLHKDDISVYEINEAFASQATMSVKHIGLDMARVNPNGGAIALGHPLGCTGARMVSTLLNELKRQGKQYGVISMCIGSGMGAAGVFENEQL